MRYTKVQQRYCMIYNWQLGDLLRFNNEHNHQANVKHGKYPNAGGV